MIGRVLRIVRTPFTLLVLLGVLCYGAWWGWSNVIDPIPAAAPQPCVSQPVKGGRVASSQVTVSVFNGGDRRGLAGDVGRSLRERGFRVLETSNTADEERYRRENVNETVIIGAGAKNPEVLLVKSFFKKAKVKVDRTRVDRSVDVLVGNRYGGFNKKAKTSIAVKAPTVCLPSARSSAAVLDG